MLKDVSCSLTDDFPSVSGNDWIEVAVNDDGNVITTVQCSSSGRSILSRIARRVILPLDFGFLAVLLNVPLPKAIISAIS